MLRTPAGPALVLFLSLLGSASCGRLHPGAANSGASSANDEDALLRRALQGTRRPAFVTNDKEGAQLWTRTRTFYEKRGFEPAWIRNGAARKQMDALIGAISASRTEGLDPELYGVSLLEQKRKEASSGFLSKKGFEPQQAAVLDTWLTYLYLKYASDLADGISDLAHADPSWQIDTEPFEPLDHLERALRDNRVAESLMELTPTDPEYRALRKALADYRALGPGGWPSLPPATRLKPGQRSPAAKAVALRLVASHELDAHVTKAIDEGVYDAGLQEAVKRFQRNHGLPEDGVVAGPVVAELNVPVAERIRQIELNMERWRWLPRELGDPHVLVNLPQMRLDVRDRGNTPVSMRVVVGKQDTPTPIFNQRMTYLVFAPYWNVPDDIARKETLPAVMKDPGFLERTSMEVVDAKGQPVDPGSIDLSTPGRYRFRQRPGTSNSLGLVKFMFPNQYNVYLHDTPADSLFARASRSFSHGCVRLEAPQKLAQFVLRDQPEWTPERIDTAMHGAEEQTVKLKSPVPVYLGYWTARVAADGAVQFWKDVYGIDARQTVKLAERLDRLRRSTNAIAALAAPRGTPAPAGRPAPASRSGEVMAANRAGSAAAVR